jgi:hypothetical protein
MTVGSFFLGLTFTVIGFLGVWKSYWFRKNIGDINELFGVTKMTWLNWDVVGIFLIVFGVIIMFGLFQAGALLFLGPLLGQGI